MQTSVSFFFYQVAKKEISHLKYRIIAKLKIFCFVADNLSPLRFSIQHKLCLLQIYSVNFWKCLRISGTMEKQQRCCMRSAQNSQCSNWCQVMQTAKLSFQLQQFCRPCSVKRCTAACPINILFYCLGREEKSRHCCSWNTEIIPCYTSKYDRSEHSLLLRLLLDTIKGILIFYFTHQNAKPLHIQT